MKIRFKFKADEEVTLLYLMGKNQTASCIHWFKKGKSFICGKITLAQQNKHNLQLKKKISLLHNFYTILPVSYINSI